MSSYIQAGQVVPKDDDVELSCVICVGSTGAGKSSTIGKCTKIAVPTGNGVDRVTAQCTKYDLTEEAKEDVENWSIGNDVIGLSWVDTVGWDDPDLKDDSTFKEILKFIDKKQLLRVKAIIWNILPNCRKDALLTKQAGLINLFKPKDIWDNVLIVCKQSTNPKKDVQGALTAAREFNPKAKPAILGFTYIDDDSLTQIQRSTFQSLPKELFYKTDDEVRQGIFKELNGLKEPVLVVFKNHKCLDCGLTGDLRLMSSHCHMKKEVYHPKVDKLRKYHPEKPEKYHKCDFPHHYHPRGIYKPWWSLCCCCICGIGGERYQCCNVGRGEIGCQQRRQCCLKDYEVDDGPRTGCEKKFPCCTRDVKDAGQGCEFKYEVCDCNIGSPGCMERCRKCHRIWGTPADECEEKEHNIIDIENYSKVDKDCTGDLITF